MLRSLACGQEVAIDSGNPAEGRVKIRAGFHCGPIGLAVNWNINLSYPIRHSFEISSFKGAWNEIISKHITSDCICFFGLQLQVLLGQRAQSEYLWHLNIVQWEWHPFCICIWEVQLIRYIFRGLFAGYLCLEILWTLQVGWNHVPFLVEFSVLRYGTSEHKYGCLYICHMEYICLHKISWSKTIWQVMAL